MGKLEIRPPCRPKTREPMVTKMCMCHYRYIPDTYREAKFYYDAMRGFWPPVYAKLPIICSIIGPMFARLVLGFFQLTPKAAAPILTLNRPTLKDVVSRKDVPFKGPEN